MTTWGICKTIWDIYILRSRKKVFGHLSTSKKTLSDKMIIIVVKAFYGQRFPLPLCSWLWGVVVVVRGAVAPEEPMTYALVGIWATCLGFVCQVCYLSLEAVIPLSQRDGTGWMEVQARPWEARARPWKALARPWEVYARAWVGPSWAWLRPSRAWLWPPMA